ncbi:MAG: AlpA family phage regulatory protein [Magnetococcales bacterium]|nr:AlpA family phage regulatory protein [Magnetococcales bacterium]
MAKILRNVSPTHALSVEASPPQQPDRILRRREVQTRVGTPCSTLYNWIEKGIFPKPIQLGPRNVGWLESTVAAWIASRQPAR